MVDIKQKIKVELDNIVNVIEEINKIKDKKGKTVVELAGIATFVHNFYNGIENILKQILQEKKVVIARSESWHKDLLEHGKQNNIISKHLKDDLYDYLAFRHFFVHAYGFMIDESEMFALISKIERVLCEFQECIKKYLK